MQSQTETKPQSFEQSLERLQAVVSLLEGGNLSLGESLRLFEEGVGLVRSCQAELAEAEHQVELLLPTSGDRLQRQPFVVKEDGER